jgi:hypothetical protein
MKSRKQSWMRVEVVLAMALYFENEIGHKPDWHPCPNAAESARFR